MCGCMGGGGQLGLSSETLQPNFDDRAGIAKTTEADVKTAKRKPG